MINSPPAPGPAPVLQFPRFHERKLRSGLDLICLEDDYLPQVSVQFGWPGGSAHDPESLQGLSPLTMEMLKEGTESRTSRAIAEMMDRRALDLDVEVQPESTILSLTALTPHLESGLELLIDLIQRPAFPDHELARVKSRWRSLLLGQRAEPGFLASEAMLQELFPGHPYGRASIPVECLERISRESMLQTVRRLPMPGTLAAWAGQVTGKQAVGWTERYFRDWEVRNGTTPTLPVPPPPGAFPVLVVDRPGSVQARLALGRIALPIQHPDYLALKLANQVLGGGASSRLFLNLREQKGLTYGIYSGVRGFRNSGVLTANASLRAESVGVGITAIHLEMKRLLDDPPAPAELERAKAELTGSYLRQMETPGAAAKMELYRRLSGLPEDYFATYLARLDEIATGQLLELAERWLQPGQWCIAVVGDRRLLEPQLHTFGELRCLRAGTTRLEPMEEP